MNKNEAALIERLQKENPDFTPKMIADLRLENLNEISRQKRNAIKQKKKDKFVRKLRKGNVKHMQNRRRYKEELHMKKMLGVPLTEQENEWYNRIKQPIRTTITMEEARWTIEDVKEQEMKEIKEMKKGNPSWEEGKSGNPMGRPKGSKGKWSQAAKLAIQDAFSWSLSTLQADLESMTPSERIRALSLLAKYVLAEKKSITKKISKVNRIEVSFSDDFQTEPISINNNHVEELDYDEENENEND